MGKTFLEMLEEVPPLLHECVSALAADMISDTEAECNLSDYHINHDQAFHEGIAQFRNISKKASQIGLQAVSGYCMRLTPQLKHRELGKYHEPLIHHLKVAKLLCRANIQRLRVEVEVFKGGRFFDLFQFGVHQNVYMYTSWMVETSPVFARRPRMQGST